MVRTKNQKLNFKSVKDFILKHKIIILIIVFGFLLRFMWLKEFLFFGFEQGRDFIKLIEIARGDFVLIGPKTDIDGIFHGAFSYYLLFPLYLIALGNPLLVQLQLILIHCLSLFVLYIFASDTFNKRIALMTSFIYAISYSAIIYSRWLSNPNLVPVLFIFVLYSLFNIKSKPKHVYLLVISLTLIFHLEAVAFIVIIIPVVLYLLIEKVKISKLHLIVNMIIGFLLLSPYLIFNIKNNNIIVNGLKNVLNNSPLGQSSGLSVLDEFRNEIVDDLFYLYPKLSIAVFFVLFAFLLIMAVKKRNYFYLLLFFIVPPLIYLMIGVKPLRHFFIYYPVIMSLAVAAFLNSLLKRRYLVVGIAIFLSLAISQISNYKKRIPINEANFLYHAQRMYYSDEINLIDFVYKEAGGSKFSYDYFSIPYWKKESWEYMFTFYGMKQYGYLPVYDRTEKFFVLYEPDETQPLYQENWYKTFDKESVLLKSFKSGKLTAEMRQKK